MSITEIYSEQARAFSILRRPQRAGDALPDADALVGGGMGRGGLNSTLARRATTQIGEVWVVPGNGYIAIFAGGATCTTTDFVVQKGLMLWGSSREMRPKVLAQGLVPDGVAEVTLFATAEPWHLLPPGAEPKTVQVEVRVSENVYGAVLPGEFLSGQFSGPDGRVEFGPRPS